MAVRPNATLPARPRHGAYGQERDINQRTISAKTVENDPQQTSGERMTACGWPHVSFRNVVTMPGFSLEGCGMEESRKLAAILVADVVGFSRLAGTDEDRTLARLRALRSDLIDPTIAVHKGRVVKRTGDGAIVEFRSVVDAVRCAIEIQNSMIERNAGLPPERRIEFRIGIHLGDVARKAMATLWVTVSILPRAWKASLNPERYVFRRTPTAR
jgi:class 3 adenylate cyclase